MVPITSSYFALIPPLVLALLSLVLWCSWWLQRRSTHLLWMGLCCALASLPYGWQVLMPTREIATWAPLLSLLYFGGALCWTLAVTTRMRVAMSVPTVSLVFVTLMATNVFFARVEDVLAIRVAALCLFLGVLVAQCTPALLRSPPRGALEHSIVGVNIAFAVFLLIRPLLLMQGGGNLQADQVMRDTLFWWITVTGSLLFCLLMGALLLASGVQHTIDVLSQERNQDPLTGLLNRRGIQEAASLALRRNSAQRWHTVALCDLDHFKQVNDRWGHPQGDMVLQTFAAHLRAGIREHDLAARYGGEEFVLLLLDVRPEHALPVLERMRQRFHAYPFTHPQGVHHVSSSFGMALLAPGDALDLALERADAQLYRAKQLGRNRVCVDGTEQPNAAPEGSSPSAPNPGN